MVICRPNRRPRNWKSDGRKLLERLTSLNRELEKVFRDEVGYYAANVAPMIVEFYGLVEPLSNVRLDSCFLPIRQEIRAFAGEVGLKNIYFVQSALRKLLADEKAARKKRKGVDSLSTGGYVTQDFSGPKPLPRDADGGECKEVARTDVPGVGE